MRYYQAEHADPVYMDFIDTHNYHPIDSVGHIDTATAFPATTLALYTLAVVNLNPAVIPPKARLVPNTSMWDLDDGVQEGPNEYNGKRWAYRINVPGTTILVKDTRKDRVRALLEVLDDKTPLASFIQFQDCGLDLPTNDETEKNISFVLGRSYVDRDPQGIGKPAMVCAFDVALPLTGLDHLILVAGDGTENKTRLLICLQRVSPAEPTARER